MTIQFKKYGYFSALVGPILSGLFVYIVLTYLLIAPRITIPTSIAIFSLIFGLTIYYSSIQSHSNRRAQLDIAVMDEQEYDIDAQDQHSRKENLSNILFVSIFGILIIISSISHTQDSHVFTNWKQISAIEIIQLGSAVLLCFFIPGYGIVLIINKRRIMNPIFRILLAYLFSMMVTGLTGYISALTFDIAISESKILFIGINLTILASLIISYLRLRKITLPINAQSGHYFHYRVIENTLNEYWIFIRKRASELLVFGSLFMLIITSTYVLYGGVTIGDQWYHQGRALSFMSGSFREAVISQVEIFYPPFQSVLLASLTTIAGIPLVNSYASIAFLNIMPMFSFYYFYTTWVPLAQRKSALLASALFVLSAGFGWIFLLTNSPQPIISQLSSLEALRTIGHLDIISASNFVIPTGPDFSTGLLYIALPAGFVLLGTIRTGFHDKFINIIIVTSITVLGIISHYEFYFFIIISSLLPLVFKMNGKNYVYVGILSAISIVYLMNNLTPGNFFTSLKILGYPLLDLAGLFVSASWAIYLISGYLPKILQSRLTVLNAKKKNVFRNKTIKFVTIALLIFLASYLYLLGFIVLSQLSLDVTRDHTSQGTVPWYLYPMKLGIAGLFGLLLSYLL
jgi:hypothetical protein